MVAQAALRLSNRLQRNLLVVVVEVLVKQQRVVAFFLRLHLVQFSNPSSPLGSIVICKLQVQISRIKLLVDLVVE